MENTINKEITSPIKAIRAKCMDCTCGQYREIELCPIKKCPLYPFRYGKNPYHKRASEENKAKVIEHLKEYHQSIKEKE